MYKSKKFKNILQDNRLLFITLLSILIISIVNPSFSTKGNIINITQRMAFTGIVACGVAFVIITGGIDLSVGSMQALSAFIMAKSFVIYGIPLPLSIIITLLMCTSLGAIIGILVSKFKVPAFIVTLGGMQTFRALSEIINKAQPISGFPSSFNWWASGRVLGIFTPITIVWLIVFIISLFIEKKLKVGRYMYVIGGNIEAGELSGININFYNILPYIYTSFLASLSGILLVAKLNATVPEMGTDFELAVIAAICIGGISLMGGKGSQIDVFIGVIFLTVLNNILVILGFNAFIRQIFTGVFIIIAVALSNVNTRGKDRILPV